MPHRQQLKERAQQTYHLHGTLLTSGRRPDPRSAVLGSLHHELPDVKLVYLLKPGRALDGASDALQFNSRLRGQNGLFSTSYGPIMYYHAGGMK